MNDNNLHLLRPEFTFCDSFKVAGPLKPEVKHCLVAAVVGLLIGLAAGILAYR